MISIDKARSYFLTLSILVVGVGVIAWFYVSSNGSDALKGAYSGNLQIIDFQSLAPDENGYLVCAPRACLETEANVFARIYPLSRSTLSQALFSYTDHHANIKTFRRNLGAWQFDFTENIPSEKFPHVITVQFVSISPTESSLNIYSRSELTSSSMEIHKDRIERWLRFMESSIPALKNQQ